MKDEASENVEIKIVGLEKKINELQCNIDNFVIAEDYNEIRKDADRISASLKSYQNEAMKYRMVIANIEKSLQYKPDITKQQLIDFYNEAKVQLSDMVVKRLEESSRSRIRVGGGLDYEAGISISVAGRSDTDSCNRMGAGGGDPCGYAVMSWYGRIYRPI